MKTLCPRCARNFTWITNNQNPQCGQCHEETSAAGVPEAVEDDASYDEVGAGDTEEEWAAWVEAGYERRMRMEEKV